MNGLRLVDGSEVGAEWCVLEVVEVNRVNAEWCGALILVPFSCLWGKIGEKILGFLPLFLPFFRRFRGFCLYFC